MGSAVAFAEEPQTLTLNQALDMGFNQNPAMRASQEGIKGSQYLKKAAWGLHLPNLSATASYTFMSQDIMNLDLNGPKNQLVGILSGLPLPLPPQLLEGLKQIDLSYTLQKRDFGIVGLNLIVPIYTGGKINAVNNAAKINVERAKSSAQKTEADLFTEITERYWGLAMAVQMERLAKEFVVAMENHSRDAAELEKNGIIAHTERLFVDMNLEQARASLSSAQGQRQTLQIALCGSMSTPNVNYLPITPLFVNQNVASVEQFKKLTLENSNALEQVELMVRLAKEVVRGERAAFFPEIAAMGGANLWNYNLTNQIPTWTVGAGIKLSIFDGLTREYKYSAARSAVRQTEALQEKAKIDIQILVEKIYSELTAAFDRVKAMESSILFAEEYLALREKAFSEGLSTASDVVDAELNLSKAKTERMAAAYKFDVALCTLLSLGNDSESFANYQIGDSYKPIK
ncbi:MAG: TolC family protein [Mucinivorans sp.]